MIKNIVFAALLVVTFTGNAQEIPNTLSPAAKVYGLSKFWQEVNYNFVYLDKVDRKAWDSTYQALITQVQQTPNDYEYLQLMRRFCAMLNDGHTNVWAPPAVDGLLFGKMFGETWFALDAIDDKAIVTRILKSEIKTIPTGTEIISVNGIPTAEYLKKFVEPYISSSTDYVRKRSAIQNLLLGLLGSSYDVQFRKPDGTIFSKHLTHARTTDTDFYPAMVQHPLLELKWYPGKIAYLALNSFGDEKIDSIFESKLPELYDAKALIVDLRNNGGGSTEIGTSILQYLTRDTIMQHSRYFTRQHRPAYKAWGYYTEAKDTVGNKSRLETWKAYHDQVYYAFDYAPDTIHLKARRLVVPTAILIGNNTASAAEDFLISAGNQSHMHRFGERTFGSTGQPLQLDLVGGFKARICTKKDTWPDGSAFVGVGIKPDFEVKPTVKDFVENRDPVLDKALAYLQPVPAKGKKK